MNRRKFIQQTSIATSLLLASQFPYEALAKDDAQHKLTILHTNDVHSRLDPFPMDGSKYQGMGGVVGREKLFPKFDKKKSKYYY